jgi:hypothetical protein
MDLHDELHITQEWATPIGKMHIYLPEITRQVLINLLTKQTQVTTEDTYNESSTNALNNTVYNLFDYTKKETTTLEISALKEFEKIASKIIRTYINKAWNLGEDEVINVRAFGNVQKPFTKRTAPHFHHGWDGVFVHYLTIGEEFNYPGFSEENSAAIPSDYSGDLLLLDPRPAIRMPYNNKAKVIKPEAGLTLVHPAYLWHETQTHTKSGIRAAIVINFNIENRNYDILPTPLI